MLDVVLEGLIGLLDPLRDMSRDQKELRVAIPRADAHSRLKNASLFG